jgi:LPXTG-motif cell wall-anchored protein
VDEAADPGRNAASGQAGVDASGPGELPRTGAAGLTAWLAAGAVAVAAGAGLIVLGLRRAHR